MAPVKVACRLSLSIMSSMWLLICTLLPFNYVESLVYDRQTLLDIRKSYMDVFEAKIEIFADYTQGSILRDIPDFLRRQPLDIIQRKRRRRRGKRGGVVVRLKIHLSAGLPLSFTQLHSGSELLRGLAFADPVISLSYIYSS
ncbi:hypothetical protein DPX16_8998 [Anabarilius grahami]|uniref:Uncharacterized protein n=1 Tax=Anabarilius grahami TaxID=495550 RepID=A0A3N0XFN7_ANAGA|nr:hypothetical protein DPX16_8998 [Anabarilius grahami]